MATESVETVDRFKLQATLDFVQGFIRPVTVIYEETIETKRAVVGHEGLHSILSPVFVRVENRNNWINVMVVKPGGPNDIERTESACRMATEYLEKGI
jgi:hypothetical protein